MSPSARRPRRRAGSAIIASSGAENRRSTDGQVVVEGINAKAAVLA
jgi:hypothetical protein